MNDPTNLSPSFGKDWGKAPHPGNGNRSWWKSAVTLFGVGTLALSALAVVSNSFETNVVEQQSTRAASVWPASSLPFTATGDTDAMPVEVMQVSKTDQYVRSRTFTGVVKATRESQLSFERLGKVKDVAVDVGDRVKANQILAGIDARRLETKRDGLQAQKLEALAILAELIAGPRQQTIDAQKAAVADLKAQVDAAKQITERRQRLLQSSASSQESAEQSAFSLSAVQARYEAAKSNLDELIAGTRPEKIDAQESTIKRLDALIADVDIEIDESRLVAPYDALVIERAVDEGSIAKPGETVFCIIEDASVEIWVGVPTEVATSVNIGQNIDVLVRGRTYQGSVRALIADLDRETLTQTIVMTLKNITLDQIIPGEVARATLGQTVTVDGYWIPISAISRGGQGLWSVLSVVEADNGKLVTQIRDVELIETAGERVLVRGMLADGELIISNGTHRLAPNQSVRIDNLITPKKAKEEGEESEPEKHAGRHPSTTHSISGGYQKQANRVGETEVAMPKTETQPWG